MYTNIYHLYGLYNGCIGQYGVIFGEQLSGYPPKCTEHFPLKVGIFDQFLSYMAYVLAYVYPIHHNIPMYI